MSNWVEDKLEVNKKIAERLLPELTLLKKKYPNENKTIDPIINELSKGLFNDDFLLDMRNRLRRIITKDERNIIQKKDDIWDINLKIKQIENELKDESSIDICECFFADFEFEIGKNFYYLKFPKLNVYTDKKEKSEFMIDRYIRDFLSNSISNYQQLNNINIEIFETFTLIFLHHITPENAKKYDTDNIEIKKPIDGINGRLIQNDTSERSDIVQIVVPEENEFTELYVIKGHGFSRSVTKLLKELKQ